MGDEGFIRRVVRVVMEKLGWVPKGDYDSLLAVYVKSLHEVSAVKYGEAFKATYVVYDGKAPERTTTMRRNGSTFYKHTVTVTFPILSDSEEPPEPDDVLLYVCDAIEAGNFDVDTVEEFDPEGENEAYMEALGWGGR